MQIEVTCIKTGEVSYHNFPKDYPRGLVDRKDLAYQVRFYRSFKENGMRKYRVKINK